MPRADRSLPAKQRRYRKQVGQRLRHLREACGLTQVVLAAKVGLSSRQLGNIEAGTAATTTDTAVALADALGVEVEQITASLDLGLLAAQAQRYLDSLEHLPDLPKSPGPVAPPPHPSAGREPQMPGPWPRQCAGKDGRTCPNTRLPWARTCEGCLPFYAEPVGGRAAGRAKR